MARSEARVSVDIWNDPDFRALPWGAQWCYMFLLSQQDLAHTGVLALRIRRWAQSADDMPLGAVKFALDALERARFIVIDYDTEELLVRSFIRRDKVFKQPQVFRAAADQLVLVTSPVLRFALAVELERVSREDMVEASRAILSDMRAALPDPTEHPAQQPQRQGNDEAARTGPEERGVVTAVVTEFPVPRSSKSPDPDPLPLASLAVGQPARKTRSQPDVAFDEFWAVYPRKEAKAAARKAWDKAIHRADPVRICAAAAVYRDSPGRDPKFTAHAATWLNADRWDDEPMPRARASPDGQREYNGLLLNERTIANLEREHRLAAQDANGHLAIGGSP